MPSASQQLRPELPWGVSRAQPFLQPSRLPARYPDPLASRHVCPEPTVDMPYREPCGCLP